MIELILLLLNIYGAVIMFIDKQKARKHQWRISEAHLWIVTFIGGALGIFIGMKLFRHKTKHPSFRWGVPVMVIIQIVFYIMVVH